MDTELGFRPSPRPAQLPTTGPPLATVLRFAKAKCAPLARGKSAAPTEATAAAAAAGAKAASDLLSKAKGAPAVMGASPAEAMGLGTGAAFAFAKAASAGAGAVSEAPTKGRGVLSALPATGNSANVKSAQAAMSGQHPKDMDEEMSAVFAFLSRHNLQQYLTAFRDSGFDAMASVHLMTDSDMCDECGMSPRDCEILKKAIASERCRMPFAKQAAGQGSSPGMKSRGLSGSVPPSKVALSIPGAGLLKNVPGDTLDDTSVFDQTLASPEGVPLGLLKALAPSTGLKVPPTEKRSLAETVAFMKETGIMKPGISTPKAGGLAQVSQPDEHGASSWAPPPLLTTLSTPAPLMTALLPAAPLLEAPPGGLLSVEPLHPSALLGATSVPMSDGSVVADPNNGATTLYALAQLAEESAQYATAAAAFCANPPDLNQVTDVANAAEQAVQRAVWASKVISSYEPVSVSLTEDEDSWLATIKGIINRAAEVAEQAVANCRVSAKAQRKKLPFQPPPTGEKRSRVPCRFFESGMCPKGDDCPLSHDPLDKKPRLLLHKRPQECRFYATNQCIRGSACTFAHGAEELATIIALKEEQEIKKSKGEVEVKVQVPREVRPGDWDCPGCGDLQFARNVHCRRCGSSPDRSSRRSRSR